MCVCMCAFVWGGAGGRADVGSWDVKDEGGGGSSEKQGWRGNRRKTAEWEMDRRGQAGTSRHQERRSSV